MPCPTLVVRSDRLNLTLLRSFNLNQQLDLFTDRAGVSAHAEVAAVDRRCGVIRAIMFASIDRMKTTLELSEVQRDRLGDATQGQLSIGLYPAYHH